jgi:hypothetical protein
MPKAKESDFEKHFSPMPDDEDESTLAAIDEGIQDAKVGRVVPASEVRKLLPKWTTPSSTRKGR